jgi:hypothetical protein
MSDPLPSNDEVEAFSQQIPWQVIDQQKRRFNNKLKQLANDSTDDELALADLSKAAGIPVSTLYPESDKGNVLLGNVNGHNYVLGSFISKRYRYGKTALQSVIPYNFNPSVHHRNLHESNNPTTELRALGAELELGLYYPDGTMPTEEDVLKFSDVYRTYARKLGITPTVDREACMYQVEVHVAPGVGYHRTRHSIESIMKSLIGAGRATGLYTAIMSAFPVLSDFALTDNPKVHTAVDVMREVNDHFPEYVKGMDAARKRYHMADNANVVQIFRIHGCHIHLDIAGRSEALGLFTFYTMSLRQWDV